MVFPNYPESRGLFPTQVVRELRMVMVGLGRTFCQARLPVRSREHFTVSAAEAVDIRNSRFRVYTEVLESWFPLLKPAGLLAGSRHEARDEERITRSVSSNPILELGW